MRRAADCDGARHRHYACVADAQPPFDDAKFNGDPCGATPEPDLRRCTRRAMDDHIGERDAGSEPCTQCFQDSLLRGEPAGKALDPVGAVADFIELLLREAPRNQRIARIVDPTPHLADVHQIDPVPDNVHINRRFPPDRALITVISHAPRRATTRCPSG